MQYFYVAKSVSEINGIGPIQNNLNDDISCKPELPVKYATFTSKYIKDKAA
jgi:hypothetical protein